MNRTRMMFALVGLTLFAAPALAQRDAPNSRDHRLVGRFTGAAIGLFEESAFDAYTLPLGRLIYRNDTYSWSRSERIEGKITRITYIAPQGATTLAIQRSYASALKQAGFEILFTGGTPELGLLYPQWYDATYPYPEGKRRYLLGSDSQQLIAARLTRPEGNVYAIMYAATGNVSVAGRATIELDMVEIQPLAAGLVTAASMASALDKSGSIALYTLYFDTGRAELTAQSDPTLKEIAQLLQTQRTLNLHIVGHTDNVGTLASNMDLSQRRAQAVVTALTGRYGVAAARLRAAGVGPLAPVAANSAPDGRTKNRRVELVAQ